MEGLPNFQEGVLEFQEWGGGGGGWRRITLAKFPSRGNQFSNNCLIIGVMNYQGIEIKQDASVKRDYPPMLDNFVAMFMERAGTLSRSVMAITGGSSRLWNTGPINQAPGIYNKHVAQLLNTWKAHGAWAITGHLTRSCTHTFV